MIARNVRFPGTMASIEGFLEVAGQHSASEGRPPNAFPYGRLREVLLEQGAFLGDTAK